MVDYYNKHKSKRSDNEKKNVQQHEFFPITIPKNKAKKKDFPWSFFSILMCNKMINCQASYY